MYFTDVVFLIRIVMYFTDVVFLIRIVMYFTSVVYPDCDVFNISRLFFIQIAVYFNYVNLSIQVVIYFNSVVLFFRMDRIGGVMVSLLPSSVVDHGFEPRTGHTKYYEIGIWFFSAEHSA
jgi:hypothetical protein